MCQLMSIREYQSPTMRNLEPSYLHRIDQYWADFLGCTVAELHSAQTTVVYSEHSPGLFCLTTGSSRVLSIHSDLEGCVSAVSWPQNGQLNGHTVHDFLAPFGRITESYGPGKVFYCTPGSFLPGDEQSSRALTPDDQPYIEEFAHIMGWSQLLPLDVYPWVHPVGILQDGRLASMTAVLIWGDVIGAIMVGTLPEYRNRGYARAVVRSATRWMLEETGLIPQYDTAVSNLASLQIAQDLGYQPYGHIAYGKLLLDEYIAS